ncbi:MAG TPA: XVIPCD domain-containing protein [Lysobacter sp.]|nr:XVIPCD domain-containing protein [Lysobacter sp.]
MEAREPTAPDRPRAPLQQEGTSSSLRDDRAERAQPDGKRDKSHVMQSDPLHRQAQDAVRRLDAGMGRTYDQHSACMAASAACLARANGFDRIDHVVLSEATASHRKGENVFVVQGGLTDATNRVAFMKTQDAIAMPVEQLLTRLEEAVSVHTPPARQHEVEASRQPTAHRITV